MTRLSKQQRKRAISPRKLGNKVKEKAAKVSKKQPFKAVAANAMSVGMRYFPSSI